MCISPDPYFSEGAGSARLPMTLLDLENKWAVKVHVTVNLADT